jgi:hypothetical protein
VSSNFLKPNTTYIEIISKLAEKNNLTRREIAKVLEPSFPYIPRPENLMHVLSEVDRFIDALEKNGMVIKFSYKGNRKDYTVKITERGLDYAEKLRKSERNESS